MTIKLRESIRRRPGHRSAPPELSIVVVFYNMEREGPRTLLSLIPPFQRNVDEIDYEIIGIEHGSSSPVPVPDDPELNERLRLIRYETAPVSPVKAINDAVRNECRGRYVMVYIDGARIGSSHLVSQTLKSCRSVTNPFVATLSWHLGPDVQMQSVKQGYSQLVEDEILERIDWYNHPEGLFGESVLAGSCRFGYFHPIAESNAFTLERERFLSIGGYMEGFASPGGGLANLEIFSRIVEQSDTNTITLIGDGTFHQYHGGAATSDESYFDAAQPEHIEVTGRDYRFPRYDTLYRARFTRESQHFLQTSMDALSATGGKERE